MYYSPPLSHSLVVLPKFKCALILKYMILPSSTFLAFIPKKGIVTFLTVLANFELLDGIYDSWKWMPRWGYKAKVGLEKPTDEKVGREAAQTTCVDHARATGGHRFLRNEDQAGSDWLQPIAQPHSSSFILSWISNYDLHSQCQSTKEWNCCSMVRV